MESLSAIFPDAPVYTSVYKPEKIPGRLRKLKVISSSVHRLPFFGIFSKQYTLIYPLIFEGFNLSGYDVVISSTANFAKGIITRPETLHICYCHTPPRFLYHYETEVNRRKIGYLAPILAPVDSYFRVWDFNAAQRVDQFVTNSRHTALRINKFYRRPAKVIYPPVRLSTFTPEPSAGNYFLIVSRLSYYKRIDLAIEACNRLKVPLKIVGMGKDRKRLEGLAGETVEFVGWVDDDDLSDYYRKCKAVLFPAQDDFGIVPVEAMGYGKPVIAFGMGGALETVIPGTTGEFFFKLTADSLAEVIEKFDPTKYYPEVCRKQAEKFSEEKFKRDFKKFVEETYQGYPELVKDSSGNLKQRNPEYIRD